MALVKFYRCCNFRCSAISVLSLGRTSHLNSKGVAMKVFIQNRDFRQLTINQWISTVGDTIFYLAFFELCSRRSFLAIYSLRFQRLFLKFCKSLWSFSDFQHHRVLKYTLISFVQFVLYSIVALSLSGRSFSLWLVFFYLFDEPLVGYIELLFRTMLTPIL